MRSFQLLFIHLACFLLSSQSFKLSRHLNSVNIRQIIKKSTLPFLAGLTINNPATWAVDTTSGKAVFESNCAFCHKNGGNALPFAADKTLKIGALEVNNLASQEALVNIITNGKSSMPSYGNKIGSDGKSTSGRLSSSEINLVAEYVLNQANAGWK